MNKDEKAAEVDEIAERLGEAASVFAVDYRGISVTQAAELRGSLAEADATFRVVKNRLAKRAAEKAGTTELDEMLTGPTALTFVKGDAVTAAKAISTFSRRNDVLAYKGGLMDGAPLDPDQFTSIARLPALDVLQGQLVGMAASPLTGLIRGLASMLSGLAVGLGEVRERGLLGGEAPTAAEGEGQAEAAAAEEGSPEEGDTGAAEAGDETPESAGAGEDSETESETPDAGPETEGTEETENEEQVKEE